MVSDHSRDVHGDVSSWGFSSMIIATRFSELPCAHLRDEAGRQALKFATEGVEDQNVAIPKRGRLISGVCSVCTKSNNIPVVPYPGCEGRKEG